MVLLAFSATGCQFLERFAIEGVFKQLCDYVVLGGEEGVDGIVGLHIKDAKDEARMAYTILDTLKFSKFQGQNTEIVINGNTAVLTTDIAWTRTNILNQTVSGVQERVEYKLKRVDFLEWKFIFSGDEDLSE